jgi:hypothetical protein
MSDTDGVDPQQLAETQRLRETADELRPPIQAFLKLMFDSVQVAGQLHGDPDEIWAATVVNVARGLQLDIASPQQMGAAMFVAEVVMANSGIEG